ncbi:MAG: glycosyltransferase family 2 protein [Rhizobiales bacterium]|nr:glycosyltransferase family 2 protein [Hyphomicrobiales bacterium]
MRASVIIRSKDEADRLRLTLRSLAEQTEPAEVVVVNDGSTDHTHDVIAEATGRLALVPLEHKVPLGRSGAANAGAALASGDILIFLDGDTLAGPQFVVRHMDVHRSKSGLVGRGETHQLRCTRFFADPETGSPRPGEEERVAAISASEMTRMRVTLQDVSERFESIHNRSQPGIYPGAGPRRLFELEMDALRAHPDCSVLWAAASGSNQSVSREAFLASGGFNDAITINEHRELALRLCQAGARMVPVDGAFTYHLTHRTGWRDPVGDPVWEQTFYQAHPIPAVPLMSVFWASLSDPLPFPPSARIASLPDLEAAAERYKDVTGIENVRRAHLNATALEVAAK